MIGIFVGLVIAVCMFAQGYLVAIGVVQRRVFRPWLDSIEPNKDPHFWLRSRDYDAAWRGFTDALPFGSSSRRKAQFTDAPQYADRTSSETDQ